MRRLLNPGVLLAAVAGAVLTITSGNAVAANPAIRAAASQLRLSLGSFHQDYVEDDTYNIVPTSYVDKETGNIPALALDFSNLTAGGFYFRAHALYAAGDTDYDGYTQPNIAPYKTETMNHFLDTRGNFGYLIGVGSRVGITPQIELGYTYWNRQIKGSGNTIGVEEDYFSYRYGIGLEASLAATERLVFLLEGTYGRQHSKITSDVLDESLGTNPYTRLTAGVDYRLTTRMHLGFRATRVHYKFDESAVSASGFFEPSSETTHTRFMASIGWSLF